MSSKQPHYHVIYRACDVVKAVNGGERPFGLSKTELVKVCFKSLFNAIKEESFQITVLGDKLSNELRTFFNSYSLKLIEGDFGNESSLRACFELSFQIQDDHWVYFCEDDYLHKPECFVYISDLIVNKNQIIHFKPKNTIERFLFRRFSSADLFIHPPDYPDRYYDKYTRPSLIFKSSFCHWRQINYTTFTFMAQAKSLKKVMKTLLKYSYRTRDWKMSEKLYADFFFMGKKALCISPIPGLSTHMHEHTMTPFVKWETLL